MKSKTSDKMAELAALRQKIAADVPPVLEATPPPPPPGGVAKSKRRAAPAMAKPADSGRERTAVSLSAPAVQALRQIRTMLMNEGGTSASASGVMCVALEFAASELAKNKQRLIELYAENGQTDKRRRPE